MLRLHLNENTAGCSPAVLDVLSRLGRGDAGVYPDYEEAAAAVAASLGVPVSRVVLTNGMDEGILAAVAASFRDRRGGMPEGLGVRPAFDMYETFVTALGGRMVTVAMDDGFRLPVQALLDAVTPDTQIVFVTNPHNPTGALVPANEIRALARRLAPILVFVDEAYGDFAGESVLDNGTLSDLPNLVVGRTFSKAYGLAGLRAGALVAREDTLAPMRRVVPPFSLNAWVTAVLPAAVRDRDYRNWYVAQSAESRRLLADACTRLGLRTWPSHANFLLIHVGHAAPAVVAALAARGIRVRDRSQEAGCEGCIRITAGLVEDTRRLIPAFEEVVCAGR
ncbi:MAG TPA: histidinol-phosphate transaminase [Vicinamibacterales bacterium]|jgi:histidinol-phosphate aminotransferase